MDENAPQPGHMSDDGQWVWTGDQWAPTGAEEASGGVAYSEAADPPYATEPVAYAPESAEQGDYYAQPYGQDPATGYAQPYSQDPATGYAQPGLTPESGWRWDGQQWVPVAAGAMPPPGANPAKKQPNLLLIGGLVAVVLILGLIAVWLLTRGSSSSTSTTPAATATASVQPTNPASPSVDVSPTFDPSASSAPTVFGSPGSTSDPLSPQATSTGPLTVDQAAAAVNWSRFSPGVQAKVDAAAASGNCAELQTLRQTAQSNSASVLASTGQGTEDLVAYIEAQERAVGCAAAPAP